jgi:predicted dehydrogenase
VTVPRTPRTGRRGARVDDDGVDLFGVGAGVEAATATTPVLGDDAFVAQAKDFAAAMRGATPCAGALDGVALMRLLDAIYRSSLEGREVAV